MTPRKEINDRIEAYAKAVRDGHPEAVARLFAERFDDIVHGVGIGSDKSLEYEKGDRPRRNQEGL